MEKVLADNLNENKLKKIIINFERRFDDNQKLRIKYTDEPTKFASSETELFVSLDELQSVATQPELYHVLISKKCIPTLVSLLSHENTDISAKVIGILQDLVDFEEAEEQESIEALIKALCGVNVIDLIVSNLSRLNESNKEESLAITNSLSIIDNLIDFDSSNACKGTKPLIKWMVKQLKNKLEFNSIKLPISELLSVLLMNSAENKRRLNKVGGIDVLLQQVAYYRRVAPITGDEHEFLEQTINCLCTAILDCDENRGSFFQEEGVDLIELILREKREAIKKSNIKLSILKLFNHVLTSDENHNLTVTRCCERFVRVLGLRVLFPIFSNPKLVLSEKTKKREYHLVIDEVEEHTSAIVLALLKYCQNAELIQRILVKFAENDFEKLDRLFVMHEKYLRLVSNQSKSGSESADEADRHEKIKSSTHFTLRTIDYIILLTCYLSNHFETYDPNSGETFGNRISKILLRRPELRHQVIMEARKHIDDVAADSSEERNSLELLLKHFGEMGKGINKEPNSLVQ